MSDFRPVTNSEEYLQKYWEGTQNRFIRYWIYMRKGLGLFNEWKNYLMLAFGSYWTIKTMDWWMNLKISDAYLITIVVIGIPVGALIMILLGHWDLYRASKPQEYINAQNGTITGYQGFNITIASLETLERIEKQLKELNEQLSHPPASPGNL